VAELVDALDSKSSSARSAGSIPARGTKAYTGKAAAHHRSNPAARTDFDFNNLETLSTAHTFAFPRHNVPE
jgi:hypothetical protein